MQTYGLGRGGALRRGKSASSGGLRPQGADLPTVVSSEGTAPTNESADTNLDIDESARGQFSNRITHSHWAYRVALHQLTASRELVTSFVL